MKAEALRWRWSEAVAGDSSLDGCLPPLPGLAGPHGRWQGRRGGAQAELQEGAVGGERAAGHKEIGQISIVVGQEYW